jgi:nucleoside-diphosphate-sugar epimerase
VVVGEGGLPFHSALGSFNNDQHCMGWNRGDNPLPFVLVEDVAAAIYLAVRSDAVAGRCYNLAGDVRPSAREYLAELGQALERPLVFHRRTLVRLQALEIGKWIIKLLIRRSENPFPSWRDLKSRGMPATMDCADAKRDLGWTPVHERGEFVRRAIRVHAETP